MAENAPNPIHGDAKGPQDCGAPEWRPAPGFEAYEVSSDGRVRRGNRALRQCPDKDGYPTVCLFDHRSKRQRTTKTHRLVCEAFHGPQPAEHQVAHMDGSKDNNRVENLKWVTPRENASHKYLHGTHQVGEQCTRAVLTDAAVREIWMSPLSARAEGAKWGVSGAAVKSVRTGGTWGHLTASLPPPPDRSNNRKTKIEIPLDARAMFAAGATNRAVATAFGVSCTTAFRWRHQ